MNRVIYLHQEAPSKPPEGEACNGCGVCCAYAPCPVGQLISRRRVGACDALLWNEEGRRYLCGAVAAPADHLPRWLAPLSAIASKAARRMIAADTRCDCSLAPT
jgi:hypothetical protein